MEYNSFYGGRRGASFIIVKTFSSVAEMVSAFQQGGAYKTVNYDEYVLINTTNKNHADNGKVYRRGYDYNNALGGAIYEGQIVGPAGLAPHLELKTVGEIEQIPVQAGYTYRKGTGSYGRTENLVPGKYVESGSGNIFYNDEIEWAYCSMRDTNSTDTTAYIGFKIPYTVIDFESESVDAYYNRSNNTADFENEDLIEREDDGTHPFYEKWSIAVPKGIKGTSIDSISYAVATQDIENYTGKADDIANSRKVLSYVSRDYSKVAAGETTKKYVGKINEIEETAIDSRYHLLIYYSDPAVRAQIVAQGKNASYSGKTDWADLGYIGSGDIGAIVGRESDTAVAAIANTLPRYSAWFIVEDQ